MQTYYLSQIEQSWNLVKKKFIYQNSEQSTKEQIPLQILIYFQESKNSILRFQELT